MQGEILIVNPRRKRDRKGRFIKRATARRRRRNPIAAVNPRRRRRRRNPIALANPRRRRRRRNPIALAANPRRRRRRSFAVASRRRRRRNPRFSLAPRRLTATLLPAFIGGAGALGLDVALGALPIPDNLKTGLPRNLTRLAGAFLLGAGVGMVKRDWAKPVTLGALTVVAYGTLKDLATRFAPQLPGLAEYEDFQVGYIDPAPQLNAYMQPAAGAAVQMGAYMQPESDFNDGM